MYDTSFQELSTSREVVAEAMIQSEKSDQSSSGQKSRVEISGYNIRSGMTSFIYIWNTINLSSTRDLLHL